MATVYHGVKFTHSLRKITPTAIQATEKRLSIRFPGDYREFLETVNGGIPKPSAIRLEKINQSICIDFLYGIGKQRKTYDIEYEQKKIIDRSDSLQVGLVTIGYDPGGAPYFIQTIGDDAGRIYFYDPQGFFDIKGEPGLYLVANSFLEMIAEMVSAKNE